LLLISALDGDEWSTSCYTHLILRERAPQYQLNRRLDVLQGWSGRFGEDNTSSMPAFETQIIQLIL